MILPATSVVQVRHGVQEVLGPDHFEISLKRNRHLPPQRNLTLSLSLANWSKKMCVVSATASHAKSADRRHRANRPAYGKTGSSSTSSPYPTFCCVTFWVKYSYHHPDFYRQGLGLLSSFVQLVQAKSDLNVAHLDGLLPAEIIW